MLGIVDYYAENQETLIKAAGPGHWNDPDEVGVLIEWLKLFLL